MLPESKLPATNSNPGFAYMMDELGYEFKVISHSFELVEEWFDSNGIQHERIVSTHDTREDGAAAFNKFLATKKKSSDAVLISIPKSGYVKDGVVFTGTSEQIAEQYYRSNPRASRKSS